MIAELLYDLKRPYHWLKTGILKGLPAEIRYRFPARKLRIVAFTGTDGKTTSSTMMYHVLKSAGKKVALLSTVAAYIGDRELDTGFHVTSPEPQDLQRFMRMMVDDGLEYLVMETTSHGLYQHRTWGIKPYLAGVTNITHEHWDYHLTYDRYVAAKALLLQGTPTVILNADDESASKLKKHLNPKRQTILTYSAQDQLPKGLKTAIQARFPEAYNQMNARLVSKAATALGLTPAQIGKALATFPGVPGRMQLVPNKKGLHVVVDFAHTPHALEEALTALKAKAKLHKGSKVIAVFGCAGLRDHTKRPLMGKIAAELADVAVFTAEDPRTENVWSIIDQMKSQLGSSHRKVISIADRREALTFALTKLAKKGDFIGVFGKGHEKSMCFGTTEYPWDDVQAAQEILEGHLATNLKNVRT